MVDLLPDRYVLITAEGVSDYFPTKRKALIAFRKYKREATREWKAGFPLGPYLPWAVVAKLEQVDGWEMTDEEWRGYDEAQKPPPPTVTHTETGIRYTFTEKD